MIIFLLAAILVHSLGYKRTGRVLLSSVMYTYAAVRLIVNNEPLDGIALLIGTDLFTNYSNRI